MELMIKTETYVSYWFDMSISSTYVNKCTVLCCFNTTFLTVEYLAAVIVRMILMT